ncbi:MAG TPA: class I SAM-dependent methyltransferase [Chloroflexota bacterium]|nr:class I SAM-dependent methyltransferase [Chloroflexota bacterium]
MGLLVAGGAALVAAGALLLYVCLTRIFAVLYVPEDVFLLVGSAAGGTAAGALLAHRLGWLPSRRGMVAAVGALVAAGLTVATVAFVTGTASLNLALPNGLLAFLCFAAVGLSLGAALAAVPAAAGVVVAGQLAGAGLAALAQPFLLDAIGPVNAHLGAAGLMAAGGLALLPAARSIGRRLERRANGTADQAMEEDGSFTAGRMVWPALGAAGALAGLLALPVNLALGWLVLDPIEVNSPKSLFASIHHPQLRELVVHSEWDSFVRTDVTEGATTPDLKWVYVDGNPVGFMHRDTVDGRGAQAIRSDIGFVPFLLPGARERVLVVGAGSGQEVASAVLGGSKEVVATEESAGLIRTVRRFEGYTGDLFDRDGVQVLNQDGRSFLRSTGDQFDVIYLSLATGGITGPAGTVSGSHLYTLEAFDEYLGHLRQDGRLVLRLRDEQELTRAFNTAFQALTRRGATPVEAIRRLLAVNHGPLAERSGGGVVLPMLIVRKTPYLEDEARATYEALSTTPFQPLFVPHLEQLSPLGAFAAEGVGPAAIEAQVPYRIRPATDASPFFFEFAKGIPWPPFLAAVGLLLVTGLVTLLTRRPTPEVLDPDADSPEQIERAGAFLEDDVPWRLVAFAATVGLGLALTQFPLLHRLPLMVGHPTLGLAVVLGTLLLGGAAGSLLSLRAPATQLRPAIGWAALGAALFAIALLELQPLVAEGVRGQGLTTRTLAAVALAAPLGLCAGVPLPSVVRLLGAARREGWTSLLWGTAALGATTGGYLAYVVGVALSFGYAGGLGAVCLFAAFMMAGLRWLRAESLSPSSP